MAHPEYNIKHRIVGAFILITISIIVIPALLSEPSSHAIIRPQQIAIPVDTSGQPNFQSVIEPLNRAQEQINTTQSQRPALLSATRRKSDKTSDNKPASIFAEANKKIPANPSSTKKTSIVMSAKKETTAKKATKDKPAESKKVSNKVAKNTTRQPAGKKVPASKTVLASTTKAPEVAPAKTTSVVASVQPKQTSAAQSKTAKSSPVAGSQPVSAKGWSVRVGTFARVENVNNLTELLSNSGFQPRKTPVKTRLGAATRIWLGPYAKRTTAERISSQLKLLTGEEGYVTKQSS